MNRIKYKLYNDEDNRLEDVTSMTYSVYSDSWICDTVYEGEESEWNCPMPLIQFTGKIDQKGVEVFEGDIVKCTFLEHPYGDDDVIEVTGVVEWDQVHGGASFRVRDSRGGYDHLEYWDGLEVIGNKYTHPELLEGVGE